MSAAPINDGGPVYPCEWDYIGTNRAAANGINLRDRFALEAMQSVIQQAQKSSPANMAWETYAARMAYRMADAMLAERAKATGAAA